MNFLILLLSLFTIWKAPETAKCQNISVLVSEKTFTLKVQISGIKPIKGNLYYALYNKAEGFPMSSHSAIVNKFVPIANSLLEIEIGKVPAGTYALSFYHDANNNQKMDCNFLGIPKEGYGFSNNAKGKFGPPKFSEAAFTFTGTEKPVMVVNY